MANTLEQEQQGLFWEAIRWIHRRRPFLTAVFVILLLVLAFLGDHPPADLLTPRWKPLFVIPWALVFFGIAVRVWGAGNLRKNQEITSTGIYQMVRHPLYVGSLSIFLALFLTVGNPWVGLVLFLAMVFLVYYPTMMDEEAYLVSHFPEAASGYARLLRLVPNPARLGDAMRTDRFTFRAAYHNLGLRSLSFIIILPLLLESIRAVKEALG